MADVKLFDTTTCSIDGIDTYICIDGECKKNYYDNKTIRLGNNGTKYKYGNAINLIRVKLGTIRNEGFSKLAFRFDNCGWLPQFYNGNYPLTLQSTAISDGLFKFVVTNVEEPPKTYSDYKTGVVDKIRTTPENTLAEEHPCEVTNIDSYYNVSAKEYQYAKGYATVRSKGLSKRDVLIPGGQNCYLWIYQDISVASPSQGPYFKCFSMNELLYACPFQCFADGKYYYTIQFDANGGTGAPSSQQMVSGKPTSLKTEKPKRDGYNFVGWSESSDGGGVRYNAGELYTATKDVTFYAVWAKASCTVSYNSNGYSVVSGTMPPSSEIQVDSTYFISKIVPSINTKTESKKGFNVTFDYRDGSAKQSISSDKVTEYTFYNWNSSKEGTGTRYGHGSGLKDSISNVKQDTVLYLTVKNKSSCSVALPYKERPEYKLLGWSDKSDGSGVIYKAGYSYVLTKDTTLYAVWEPLGAVEIYNLQTQKFETYHLYIYDGQEWNLYIPRIYDGESWR